MLKVLITILIYSVISIAHAAATPLPAEQAFVFSAAIDQNKKLVLNWQMPPGYYLYRDRVSVTGTPTLPPVVLPQGQLKTDVLKKQHQVYFDNLTLNIPLNGSDLSTVDIHYQGCSSKGFCYTPMQKHLQLDLSHRAIKHSSHSDQARELIASHHIAWIIFSFLLLGLLLAFTPCVLPMIPILSSIIIGHGKSVSTQKAFRLSLAYVSGMAITYALAGILVAEMGSSIQVALQKPLIIVSFSVLFVLLALSLFGLFHISLPNRLHQWINAQAHRHQGGTYVSVFFMGSFSTLVVSPCVSAPLVGALAYIGNSGDVVLGGIALLSLGIGMGIPLLLIGTSAGKLLPKAGPWMDTIKQIFGLMMLGLSIWMMSRLLPSVITVCLWALLIIATAVLMWRLKHSKKIWRKLNQGIGLVLLSYGFILLGSIVSGFEGRAISFTVVKDMKQLEQILTVAHVKKQPVLLDFYADWCASCVVMDHYVLARPDVKKALASFVLVRADVTNNTEFDQALLKRFSVIAPPTIVFFNVQGQVISDQTIVGEVNSTEFLLAIKDILWRK